MNCCTNHPSPSKTSQTIPNHPKPTQPTNRNQPASQTHPANKLTTQPYPTHPNPYPNHPQPSPTIPNHPQPIPTPSNQPDPPNQCYPTTQPQPNLTLPSTTPTIIFKFSSDDFAVVREKHKDRAASGDHIYARTIRAIASNRTDARTIKANASNRTCHSCRRISQFASALRESGAKSYLR